MIRGGVLRARPGARIRYRPQGGVEALKKSGQGFELLLGAFEDLTVETLELTLDGDANGKMKLVLRLIGMNPLQTAARCTTPWRRVRLADLLPRRRRRQDPQQIEERSALRQ